MNQSLIFKKKCRRFMKKSLIVKFKQLILRSKYLRILFLLLIRAEVILKILRELLRDKIQDKIKEKIMVVIQIDWLINKLFSKNYTIKEKFWMLEILMRMNISTKWKNKMKKLDSLGKNIQITKIKDKITKNWTIWKLININLKYKMKKVAQF